MRVEKAKRILPRDSSPDWSQVRESLGGGTEGDVYRYGRDKAIKFVELNCGRNESEWRRLFDVLKDTNYKYIVRPYELRIFDDKAYWYTTDYLTSHLNERDEKEFATVIRILDYEWGITKRKPPAFALLRINPEWRNFIKSLHKFRKKFGFTNLDLHSQNVMKNDLGVPKLIDLESFIDWSR